MERWSTQHKVFCVEEFAELKSISAVLRSFRRRFGIRQRPSRNTISAWIQKWRETGSIQNKKSTGRPRTACNLGNEERVRNAINNSPTRSVIRHAAVLGLTDRSTRRMLRKMKFHPYKVSVVQELSNQDKINRLNFCQNFMALHNNHNIGNNLFMSDEAHFYLHGGVNKQNCRYWAEHNPHQIHQRPLHSPKLTVWCAISSSRIVGPYFFEENGQTVTVTSARYAEMLQTFFLPQIQEEVEDYWFQQDGATSHTARISMNILQEAFPNRLISRNGNLPWPARSPDIAIPDFFLWGYLKSKVYVNKPRNLEDLKTNIRNEINAIPRQILNAVMMNFITRIEECIVENGGHLRGTIFKV